jgi:hypothetical protein
VSSISIARTCAGGNLPPDPPDKQPSRSFLFSILIFFRVSVFYFGFKIPIQIQINPADNNARNAYLLSLLMLFTGMITYPSTANRISNFFFLIGTMSFLAGHLLYFIKLVNLKKQ